MGTLKGLEVFHKALETDATAAFSVSASVQAKIDESVIGTLEGSTGYLTDVENKAEI